MTKYRIYQYAEGARRAEWPYDPLTFTFGDYEEVYSGRIAADIDEEALRRLYRAFTIAPPADFKGHRLAVGDLIRLGDRWYYVQPYDFKALEAQ